MKNGKLISYLFVLRKGILKKQLPGRLNIGYRAGLATTALEITSFSKMKSVACIQSGSKNNLGTSLRIIT